jgi:hypothetical protein
MPEFANYSCLLWLALIILDVSTTFLEFDEEYSWLLQCLRVKVPDIGSYLLLVCIQNLISCTEWSCDFLYCRKSCVCLHSQMVGCSANVYWMVKHCQYACKSCLCFTQATCRCNALARRLVSIYLFWLVVKPNYHRPWFGLRFD